MECFVIIVNGWKPIIAKRSILDIAAARDPPLICHVRFLVAAQCTSISIISVFCLYKNTFIVPKTLQF